MHYADLFFNFADAADVRAAASRFSSAIGIPHFDERESSNYLEDVYFEATEQGVTYEVAYADDVHAQGLRFWISVQGTSDDAEQFGRLVEGLVAHLLRAGATVSRVYELGKKTIRVVPCAREPLSRQSDHRKS